MPAGAKARDGVQRGRVCTLLCWLTEKLNSIRLRRFVNLMKRGAPSGTLMKRRIPSPMRFQKKGGVHL